MSLKEVKKIYMVGIKGVGMTALAQIVQGMGKQVSGSDTHEEFFTQEVLRKLGIQYVEGFDAKNLPEHVDLLIYATAYPPEHPERAAARARGIPELSYPQALAEVASEYRLIAICGSHGKTTTTAMMGQMLEALGMDPTVLVGSRVTAWGSNARVGTGEWMVVEADEYQNKFHHFKPTGVIVTNIDWDHPDFFPDARAYRRAFHDFLSMVPRDGWIVANASDTESRAAVEGVEAPVHWFDPKAPFPPELATAIVGVQNQANAAAVLVAADALGIPRDRATLGLASFRGTARRMEHKGTVGELMVFDDYAHHPSEITATIAAARTQYPGARLIILFQPHTFSRTVTFLKEFATALGAADDVWVTDIYGSAREQQGAVSPHDIVVAMNGHASAHDVRFADAAAAIAADLKVRLQSAPSVFITMGAGNGWKIGEDVLKKLKDYGQHS